MDKRKIYSDNFKNFPRLDKLDKISRIRAYKIFDFWEDNFKILNNSTNPLLKKIFPDFKINSYKNEEDFITCFYTNIRFFFRALELCKSGDVYLDINNTVIIAIFLMILNKKTLAIFGTNQKEFLILAEEILDDDNYKFTEKNNQIITKMFNYIWEDESFVDTHGKITLKLRKQSISYLKKEEKELKETKEDECENVQKKLKEIKKLGV